MKTTDTKPIIDELQKNIEEVKKERRKLFEKLFKSGGMACLRLSLSLCVIDA